MESIALFEGGLNFGRKSALVIEWPTWSQPKKEECKRRQQKESWNGGGDSANEELEHVFAYLEFRVADPASFFRKPVRDFSAPVGVGQQCRVGTSKCVERSETLGKLS